MPGHTSLLFKANIKGGSYSARPIGQRAPRVHALADASAITSASTSAPSSNSSESSTSRASVCAGYNRRLVQRMREQKVDLSAASRRHSFALHAVAAPERTASAMKTVEVDLGDRSYPIYIGAGLLNQGELLRKHIPGKRVLIVTNETIAPLYLER